MSRYNELLEDEYEAGLNAEVECKRCGDTCDNRYETFVDGLCTHCQGDEEIMLEEEQ